MSYYSRIWSLNEVYEEISQQNWPTILGKEFTENQYFDEGTGYVQIPSTHFRNVAWTNDARMMMVPLAIDDMNLSPRAYMYWNDEMYSADTQTDSMDVGIIWERFAGYKRGDFASYNVSTTGFTNTSATNIDYARGWLLRDDPASRPNADAILIYTVVADTSAQSGYDGVNSVRFNYRRISWDSYIDVSWNDSELYNIWALSFGYPSLYSTSTNSNRIYIANADPVNGTLDKWCSFVSTGTYKSRGTLVSKYYDGMIQMSDIAEPILPTCITDLHNGHCIIVGESQQQSDNTTAVNGGNTSWNNTNKGMIRVIFSNYDLSSWPAADSATTSTVWQCTAGQYATPPSFSEFTTIIIDGPQAGSAFGTNIIQWNDDKFIVSAPNVTTAGAGLGILYLYATTYDRAANPIGTVTLLDTINNPISSNNNTEFGKWMAINPTAELLAVYNNHATDGQQILIYLLSPIVKVNIITLDPGLTIHNFLFKPASPYVLTVCGYSTTDSLPKQLWYDFS